jgi:4-hydroxybenzoate polyprenyltransferase
MASTIRLIHPAPAAAVVLLSAALGAILLSQASVQPDWRLMLTVVSIAASQVITGATNDLADEARDKASGRAEKPLPSGAISRRDAAAVAWTGALVLVGALLALGLVPLLIGLVATASALAYNFLFSRTPLSPLPYLVSFGLLPLWISAGVGVDIDRVLPAVPLGALFAGAAHLANTLRDFDADAGAGSRNLAQVLGRDRTRLLSVVILLSVACAVGVALLIGRASPLSLALGAAGLCVIVASSLRERTLWYGILLAAVAWTAAWAVGTG